MRVFFTEILALAFMRGDVATRAALIAHVPETFADPTCSLDASRQCAELPMDTDRACD